MASSPISLIYEHNAAPIGRHLARDDVTELVINQPGWVGLETRNGWEWHEEPALDNAALMTLAKLIAGLTKQDINSLVACPRRTRKRCASTRQRSSAQAPTNALCPQ